MSNWFTSFDSKPKSPPDSTSFVRDHRARDIRANGPLVYQTPTLANASRSYEEIPQRDRRFAIDPLLKDILQNDDQTERSVAAQVEERVAALREETLARAREEGFAEGHSEGLGAGLEEYRAEAAGRLERLGTLIADLDGQRERIFRDQERHLVDLVFRLGTVVLRRELSTDREQVQRMIKLVVDEMGAKECIKIWVHADQLEEARRIRPELEASFTGLKNFTIEASPSLEPHGCVIETDWNRMDAGVDTQLQRLHARVLAKVDRDAELVQAGIDAHDAHIARDKGGDSA